MQLTENGSVFKIFDAEQCDLKSLKPWFLVAHKTIEGGTI